MKSSVPIACAAVSAFCLLLTTGDARAEPTPTLTADNDSRELNRPVPVIQNGRRGLGMRDASTDPRANSRRWPPRMS